jgi:DNA-binding helix-hairpin-helix protein with protein kinase domain
MPNIYSALKEAKALGSLLAQGGEGEVYTLPDRPDLLAKCYHSSILQQRGELLRTKIKAMVEVKRYFKSSAWVCWPLLEIFNDRDEWIGFVMKRANGVQMSRLAHAMAYKKAFPNLDRVSILNYLLSFLARVRSLHDAGVLIGDYNLNNIVCATNSDEVSLIDCDSYQMKVNGRFYPCPVGSPDMTPLEHHDVDFSRVVRTESSEIFSVAIVLFKCLMLGRHPYDVVGGEDPVSNMKHGRFAYGKGNTGIPEGPWYNIWSHMPYMVKNLFINTFTSGARNQSDRINIDEWLNALTVYRNEINKGWHSNCVRPDAPKGKKRNGRF